MKDREVERGPDGKILKAKLSSKAASEMGKLSAESRYTASKTVEGLLADEGYNDTDNIPPHYIVAMATQAVKSNAAMRDWRRYIGSMEQTVEQPVVVDCPYHKGCLTFQAKQDGWYYSEAEVECAMERIRIRRESSPKEYAKYLKQRTPYVHPAE